MISRLSFNELSEEKQALLNKAREVSSRSYNQYSGALVGAAVRTSKGRIFVGTFFETASGPEGVCAERVAIASAITAGHRDIIAIAVVGGSIDSADKSAVTPCGGCRQMIYELKLMTQNNIEVVCSNLALTNIISCEIDDLFPLPFPARE